MRLAEERLAERRARRDDLHGAAGEVGAAAGRGEEERRTPAVFPGRHDGAEGRGALFEVPERERRHVGDPYAKLVDARSLAPREVRLLERTRVLVVLGFCFLVRRPLERRFDGPARVSRGRP